MSVALASTAGGAAPYAISVLLVTQLRLYADGIASALEELDEIGRVAVERCCRTARDRLTRETIDVVVLDLAGIDEVVDARTLAQVAPPARVVVLAVREHDQDVVDWAEHGATGIVTRQASFDELRHAILAAARGECGCSPRVAAALLRRVAAVGVEHRCAASHAALTARERQVAQLLAEGLTNKEIAARLLLGVSTVKNHVHNVLSKLNARTRSEAVALLLETTIQSPPPWEPDRQLPEAPDDPGPQRIV